MKIGEFAEMNNITTKMLRHYDEIGLFKPVIIDEATGYRSYGAEQSPYLCWILILKNLDFSLNEIKDLLSGPIDSKKLIYELVRKRIEISSALNEQIQKRIQIDKLITLFEKDGFVMDKSIDLLHYEPETIYEIKNNLPNMGMFVETAKDIVALCSENDSIAVFRLDIDHFKQVNDEFGYDVGDKVIVAFYNIIKDTIKKYLDRAALYRAHGDEFLVFARAGKDEIEKTAEAIIDALRAYDFTELGCKKQITGSIGGLTAKHKNIPDIRKMVDATLEILLTAKKSGRNSFTVVEYGK